MKKYSICNMKAFSKETEVEIKPITIFVGKNSSGKSSLIRFPVVISQSVMSDADTPILFYGKDIDYGNYEDVVFSHNRRGKMHFSVCYEVNMSYRYRYLGSRKNNTYMKYYESRKLPVSFQVGLIKYSRRMIIDSLCMKIDNDEAITISRSQGEKYHIHLNDLTSKEMRAEFDVNKLHFNNYFPSIYSAEVREKALEYFCYKNGIAPGSKQKRILKEFLSDRMLEKNTGVLDKDSEKELRDLFDLLILYSDVLRSARTQAIDEAERTYYLGPFRKNPDRVYREVERQISSVGTSGENVVALLKNDYSHGKRVLNAVSRWFDKSMNYKLSLKDIGSGLYNIVVSKKDGTKDNLIDVGYGISQVLPIVTQLAQISINPIKNYYPPDYVNDESTVIIEQPELHLHPGAQADLANLFVDIVKNNADNDNQIKIMIETHSEHLIRRLQALIADKNTAITKDQVKIYYVDKDENSESYIKEMQLLDNGQFKTEWPFFDKAFELSMELVRNNNN